MDMDMDGGSSAPLDPTGVDFSNETQALNFLQELLDDSVLQVQDIAYCQYFWYGVVVLIGIASLLNVSEKLIAGGRLRAAAANHPTPSKPQNFLLRAFATATAIGREMTYLQYSPTALAPWFKIPPVGTILLLIVYLMFIIALQFDQNSIAGAQHLTAWGLRAGWPACAQLPLLILLVGKNNLIGLLTGIGYERLNVLHRWVARVLLLLVTLHFAYQSVNWSEYGLMSLEWATDTCPPTGIAAYALLLWMNLSTLAPLRNMAYEFFVVQHILTFFGLIIAIAIHLPVSYARIYIYIPSGLYLADRLVRAARLAYNNRRLSKAFLEAKDGGVTKIRIRNHQIKSWHAGSHALLSLPGLGFGQNHPATIASTPTSHDGDLVFILKSKSGFTKTLLKSAMESSSSLESTESVEEQEVSATTRMALVDGPYPLYPGRDFAAFDSLILVAASTGVTFTLSHLLNIAQRASSRKLPLRRLDFVWIVRSRSWTSWLDDELATAYAMLKQAGIEVFIRIYVTCDEELSGSPEKPGCTCIKSADGKCCCSSPDAITEADNPGKDGLSTTEKTLSTPKHLASCSSFCSGRPVMRTLIEEVASASLGEMAITVCGPHGLNETVRNSVVKISDDRAVHKGSGAQGIFLHVEAFSG